MLKMLNYKFYSDFFYPRNLEEIRGIFFGGYVGEHKNPPVRVHRGEKHCL